LSAERRLRALGTSGSLFTSGLSVGEFALLDRLGPRPLAQVLGASVHKVGWQYLDAWEPSRRAPPLTSDEMVSDAAFLTHRWRDTLLCELDSIRRAWDQARRRALDRLTEEALQLEADAVVGVHLRRAEHDWGRGTVSYVVSGTAVRFPGAERVSWPILSDLSVQDYWKLDAAGYEPAGLVASTAVVFVSAAGLVRWQRFKTAARNQELEELSRGFWAARDTLRRYLASQADSNAATGIVGVQFEHSLRREKFKFAYGSMDNAYWRIGRVRLRSYGTGASDQERRGWVITMHGAGTAIRRSRAAPLSPPQMVMRVGTS
jgi:uncharacterized protein YbjQ (UPF0145 family)